MLIRPRMNEMNQIANKTEGQLYTIIRFLTEETARDRFLSASFIPLIFFFQ